MEARSRAGLLPRLSKISSMPSIPLPTIINERQAILGHHNSVQPLDNTLEEYKPRGEDPYDSSLQDPKERKKTLKKAHLANLKSKLNKSFQLSQELTRAIDISFSVSSVKESEAEIDKLLLKTRNSMLKFQEHKLDLRRERMLRAQGSKAKVDGKTVKTLIHAILSKLPQLVKPMLKECTTPIERLHMINVCDQFERSAMHYAAFMGNLTVCEKLLAAGASPSTKDYMLRTPLHYAAIGAKEPIIEVLIRHKSHNEKKDFSSFQTHHRPSFSIKKPPIQLPDAIFLSKSDQTEFGAVLQEMDGYTTDQVTPSFQPTQVVDESRFIDCQDQFYRTPLHYAALKENYSMIKLLCSLGASLDLEDCQRRRPADCTDHQAVKKYLISRMRINNAQGDSQYFLDRLSLDLRDLANLSQKEIQQAVRKKEATAVKFLLEHGAIVTRTNKNHWNALHLAVKSAHMGVLRILLEGFISKETNEEIHSWKVDAWRGLDMVTAQGYSALHLSSKHEDSIEIIQFLLKHFTLRKDWIDLMESKPEVEVPSFLAFETIRELRCKGGYTAFLLAVKCYNLSIVKFLVKNGANIYAKTESLQNALHIAAQQEDRDMVEFLIYQDSDDNILRSEVDIRLRKPRDIDITGKLASSFYHIWDYAAMGNVSRIKALISTGALSVNEQTKRKLNSILHVAVEKAQVIVIRELMEMGADPNIKNAAGKTPSDVAAGVKDARYESIIYRLLKGEGVESFDDIELQALSQVYRPFVQIQIPVEQHKDANVYAEEWTPEKRALVSLIRDKLVERGMSVADAFELVDKDKDFCLEKVEFEGLLLWLGIHASTSQIADLLHSLDHYQTGRIEYSAVVNHIKEANKVVLEKSPGYEDVKLQGINLGSKLFRGSIKPPDKSSFSHSPTFLG